MYLKVNITYANLTQSVNILFLLHSYFPFVSTFFRYLSALGRTRTAEVQRDARIGQAEAKRDAGMTLWFSL